MNNQPQQSDPYFGGRGFQSNKQRKQEALKGPIGWRAMESTMTGSMAARWHGASADFDWRTHRDMAITPRTTRKREKQGRQDQGDNNQGRPRGPRPASVLTGPGTPGPISNQSFGDRPEWSILSSDWSKAGMGEDAPVWAPQAPSGPRESSILPAGGPYGGMGSDSSIYPAGVATTGSDSSIWSAATPKPRTGGDVVRRGRAGMASGALGSIQMELGGTPGVVRRNGGWPG